MYGLRNSIRWGKRAEAGRWKIHPTCPDAVCPPADTGLQHSRIHKKRNIPCFGCGERNFESYSAMLIHLEAGHCGNVDLRQIDHFAAKCFQSKKYVVAGYIGYLMEGMRFRERADYEVSYYTEWDWECSRCDKCFDGEHGAKQHTSSPIHDRWLYCCPCCDEEFKVPSALVQHVESRRCSAEIRPGTPVAKMLHYLHMKVSYDAIEDIIEEDMGMLI